MNTIKIILDKSASGKVAQLYKDFAMYVNSYQNKLVDVYVPKEMLYTNPQSLKSGETASNYANSVKIGGILTAEDGSAITTDSYYLDYLKETTINDVEYVVFERILPKELTTYAGNQQIVINVVSVDSGVTPIKVLQVVTTQVCNLLVQKSAYIADATTVDPTKTEEIEANITTAQGNIANLQERMTTAESNIETNTTNIATNTEDIATLKQVVGNGEEYIGTLNWYATTLPTSAELNTYVESEVSRQPKNGDVVIVIQHLTGQTDKNFKYIYALTDWTHYEIPPMELSSNGTAGIVAGTYNVDKTYNTLVDIAGGEILNIYIKDTNGTYRNLVEYINTNNTSIKDIISGTTQVGNALKAVNDNLGNNIYDTYLTKALGVTKQEMRDYAMPRVFNDVSFISSQGYQDTVPTTPESGIQFSATSTSAGDTQLFQIEKTNTADFELSAKNGYSNTIYVSADNDCQVQFRLTTEYKKIGGEYQHLNIELTDVIDLTSGNIKKINFAGAFSYLEQDVISLTDGDLIRQTLEVITTTLETITFDVYSNQTYPSIYNLTSQSYTASGGGGDVQSVNGKTGAVILNANDVGAVATSDIIDNLNSTDTTKVLSANQGKVLNDKATELDGKITTAQGNIANLTSQTTANTTNISTNTTNIATINGKIPTQASESNQLADKDFVNSSINNIAAFYITATASGDAFESYEQLSTATVFYSGGQVRTPTRNDYCVVRVDENHDNATTRYIYQNQWEFQYVVNETALTSAQLNALNSGITSALVAQISTNQTNIATLNTTVNVLNASLDNKASTDASNLSDDDVASWNSKLQTERTETVYDMTSSDISKNWGYTSGIQHNVTVNGKDFSKYKRLRVFCVIGDINGYADIDMKYYNTSSSSFNGYNIFNYGHEGDINYLFITGGVINSARTSFTARVLLRNLSSGANLISADRVIYKIEGVF